jgi:hypothetical protein
VYQWQVRRGLALGVEARAEAIAQQQPRHPRTMKKKSWFVKVPGYAVFQMGSGESISYAEALYGARLIWPRGEIEVF